jgi:acylphosphatase
MAIARVNLLVTGKVQGVFFRQSTLQQAQRLSLSGWVRNLPDGSVELEAEGESLALEALVRWAKVGPPGARVDGVQERSLAPTGIDRTFKVLPG